MITTKELRMLRGQTLPVLFTVKNHIGARVDLTGATAHFSVRTDLKAAPIVHKISPAGGIALAPQSGATLGQFTATLAPADTAALVPGDYVYDVWIVDATGARFPIVAASRLAIQAEVTVLL